MLIHRRAFALVVPFVVLGCTKDVPRQVPHAPREVHAATSTASSTPMVADPDTVGCNAIPRKQFAEPDSLIGEWIRRDSLGYFLGADDRLFELMACPGHLGGGDEIVVATGPRVRRITPVGASADFLITYRRYGRVHVDSTGNRMTFVAEPGTDSIEVNVVRTSWGWRFPSDVANPHLSPRAALEKIEANWNAEARDSLATLAQRLTHS